MRKQKNYLLDENLQFNKKKIFVSGILILAKYILSEFLYQNC